MRRFGRQHRKRTTLGFRHYPIPPSATILLGQIELRAASPKCSFWEAFHNGLASISPPPIATTPGQKDLLWVHLEVELVPISDDCLLRLLEGHGTGAYLFMKVVLNLIFFLRAWFWLIRFGPEITLVCRVPPQLKTDEMIFLILRRRAWKSPLLHLLQLQTACIG